MRMYKRPKTDKYDDFKLDFLFLHLIEYFDGVLNDQAQKYASFGLKGTLNARKQIEQISYNL